jgi:DNA-binding protein H-NS
MLDANVIPKLDTISKAELKALKRQVEDALSKVDVRRREEALKAAKRSVAEFGFSLEKILLLAARSGRKATSGKRAGQDVKFRNPENPDETWSGRGRRPTWLIRQLEAGKSQDDLRA